MGRGTKRGLGYGSGYHFLGCDSRDRRPGNGRVLLHLPQARTCLRHLSYRRLLHGRGGSSSVADPTTTYVAARTTIATDRTPEARALVLSLASAVILATAVTPVCILRDRP